MRAGSFPTGPAELTTTSAAQFTSIAGNEVIDRLPLDVSGIAAIAQFSNWHTFPVRCAAAIASGYRVTFVVRVLWAACQLMTLVV